MRRIYHRLVIVTALILSLGYPAWSEPLAADGKPIRTDLYGDPLPSGALVRMGTIRWRHAESVSGIAFSRDGTTIASGGRDGSICLWEVATGRARLRIQAEHAERTALASATDGKVLAFVGFSLDEAQRRASGKVTLWDFATGKPIRRIERADWAPRDVALAPDGTILATRDQLGAIDIWEAATGNARLHITAQGPGRRSLAFSPDSKWLASVDREVIRLWDPASGKELRKLEAGTDGFVSPPAISPDGAILAVVGIHLLAGGGNWENVLVVWDLTNGTRRRLEGHQHGVFGGVAFSPAGRTIAWTANDRTIVLCDVATLKPIGQISAPPGGVPSLAFSPDGKLLALQGGSTIHVWDVAAGQEIRPSAGPQSAARAVAFSPDGKIVASGGSYDPAIHLWDVATGNEIGQLAERDGEIYSLAFSPDGTLLAAGAQMPSITLWDVKKRKEIRKFTSHLAGGIDCLRFSPDGKMLASQGAHQSIRLTEVATGRDVQPWAATPAGELSALAFSPDARTVAIVGHDNAISLWEFASGRELRKFVGLGFGNHTIAFSPDGKALVSMTCDNRPGQGPTDRTIRLWEVATGKERCRLGQHHHVGVFPSIVAFSPDSTMVASGGRDKTVRLWDVATGKQLREFAGHEGWVTMVTFSANGKMLASGSGDTTVLIWDLASLGQGRPRQAVSLSPDKLKTLWADLADEDASKAYQALCTLVGAPEQSLPLLKEQLRPVAPLDSQRVTRLLRDLENDRFAVREKATGELEKLTELAEPALRSALAATPSVEARRRLEQLLEKRDNEILSSQALQALRAIEVLEHIGSLEARHVLAALAKGAPEARLTRETKASLERLGKWPAGMP